MLSPSVLGVVVGLALGFAAAFGGFYAFLIVAVFAVIGYVAGKVVEGEINLGAFLGSRSDRR
ncbi:MAG: DUF2273 domain-containing protein [Geodermatophilaceae bacterium]|nr:DUF2273 domain-containing protein [Geodermatophilaceae bacterium]MDQ3466547.1 DUF2273 domain-containing protein [Actinomycetota bacterium]